MIPEARISIHALLAESDCFPQEQYPRHHKFLSTLSLRRATFWGCGPSPRNGNFYPRSPCGERLGFARLIGVDTYFYPRSPCGERLGAPVDRMPSSSISIHALLAESDKYRDAEQVTFWQFLSTLSLRRATGQTFAYWYIKEFLSTLSLRRATRPLFWASRTRWISIHALLAESDFRVAIFEHTIVISIHALLAESDLRQCRYRYTNFDFYPRSPCGERPQKRYHGSPAAGISIHALLAESDSKTLSRQPRSRNFYPRSPCGERLWLERWSTKDDQFLSTLSLRRATIPLFLSIPLCLFLSTLSLRRATYDTSSLMQCQVKFLSTLSLRRATRAL